MYAFSGVSFRLHGTLYPHFGYLELKEVLTCVMNSKHFTLFTLLPGERKIGWRVRPASWILSPTLHAPVEKNNVWLINGHPIDSPAWFLASAQGQKWIRTGPRDTEMGGSKSALPVICVRLTELKSQEPKPDEEGVERFQVILPILLTYKEYVQRQKCD